MVIKNIINAAINYSKQKDEQGLLIPSNLWDDVKHAPNGSGDGDCETVYSLILLYSDDEDNDYDTLEEPIEDALWDLYPNHF